MPKKLGFIHIEGKKGKLFIPDVGSALLEGKYLENEIYLRQLLKLQINGAFPFYISLKMIYELDGLSKDEMGIFLFTTINISKIDEVINGVRGFRREIENIKGRNAKRKFAKLYSIKRLARLYKNELDKRLQLVREILKESEKKPRFPYSKEGVKLIREAARGGKGMRTRKVGDFVKDFRKIFERYTSESTQLKNINKRLRVSLLLTRSESLNSYGDLNFRYLQKTGLFTIKGNRLVAGEEHLSEIEAILSMKFIPRKGRDYLDYLHNPLEPSLPSDKKPFLCRELTNIDKKRKSLYTILRVPLRQRKSIKVKADESMPVLKKKYQKIENEYLFLKELQFAQELQKPEGICEVIKYFGSILSGEIFGDRAAHLEWNVWRAFLALNELIVHPSKCRNFAIDKDLNPYDFAPGNQPDMVFYYEDFIVIGEATLTVGPRQWSAEVEPVPRHVAKVQAEIKEKEVYGIFIAPHIDVNTAITFFEYIKGMPYIYEGQRMRLVMIPLTTKQLCEVFLFHTKQNLALKNLRELLEMIKNLKDDREVRDGEQWLERIPEVIDKWKKRIRM